MVDIAEQEPDAFTAGDTVQWLRAVSDYPPEDEWVLTYAFVSAVDFFTVTGTDNGDGRHLLVIDAATSAGIAPATYSWSGSVSQGAERFTVGKGTTEVARDLLAAQAPVDGRTHARKVLDSIEAVLEGTATTDQASYAIDGVSISRMPIPDLLTLRDRYRVDVARQEAADRLRKGLGHPGNVLVRM